MKGRGKGNNTQDSNMSANIQNLKDGYNKLVSRMDITLGKKFKLIATFATAVNGLRLPTIQLLAPDARMENQSSPNTYTISHLPKDKGAIQNFLEADIDALKKIKEQLISLNISNANIKEYKTLVEIFDKLVEETAEKSRSVTISETVADMEINNLAVLHEPNEILKLKINNKQNNNIDVEKHIAVPAYQDDIEKVIMDDENSAKVIFHKVIEKSITGNNLLPEQKNIISSTFMAWWHDETMQSDDQSSLEEFINAVLHDPKEDRSIIADLTNLLRQKIPDFSIESEENDKQTKSTRPRRLTLITRESMHDLFSQSSRFSAEQKKKLMDYEHQIVATATARFRKSNPDITNPEEMDPSDISVHVDKVLRDELKNLSPFRTLAESFKEVVRFDYPASTPIQKILGKSNENRSKAFGAFFSSQYRKDGSIQLGRLANPFTFAQQFLASFRALSIMLVDAPKPKQIGTPVSMLKRALKNAIAFIPTVLISILDPLARPDLYLKAVYQSGRQLFQKISKKLFPSRNNATTANDDFVKAEEVVASKKSSSSDKDMMEILGTEKATPVNSRRVTTVFQITGTASVGKASPTTTSPNISSDNAAVEPTTEKPVSRPGKKK